METIEPAVRLTPAQIHLAREVMSNWAATIYAGYWVQFVTEYVPVPPDLPEAAEGSKVDGDLPSALTIKEDDIEGEGRTIEVSPQMVALAILELREPGNRHVNPRIQSTLKDMWDSGDYLGENGPGGDFESDDVVIQYAAFGEVVYG